MPLLDACTGTTEHDSQNHPVSFIQQRAGVTLEPAATTPLLLLRLLSYFCYILQTQLTVEESQSGSPECAAVC